MLSFGPTQRRWGCRHTRSPSVLSRDRAPDALVSRNVSLDTEGGYSVECQDDTHSHAGGIQGVCSDHGGEHTGEAPASRAGRHATRQAENEGGAVRAVAQSRPWMLASYGRP